MKKLVFLVLCVGVMATSCMEDDDMPQENILKLNISGLENLGPDYAYEGWIIVNGNAISTGVFTVNNQGNMSATKFMLNEEDLEDASTFVLTIEPSPDNDAGPSAVHVLAGDFSGTSASLTVGHQAALGNDFSGTSGKYILATPTTTTTADELSGVWFLDLGSGSPMAGLQNLPDLPNGWVYEGWVVVNGQPVTSGKFSKADIADDSAPFSGSDSNGPPFPGEDYVMNAPAGLTFPTSLAGGKAVISIEPDPDNSPNPFTLKPLVGDIPSNASDHVTYDMGINIAGFPQGTAIK